MEKVLKIFDFVHKISVMNYRSFGPTKNLVKLLNSKNSSSIDILREIQALRSTISRNLMNRIDGKDRKIFMTQLWSILLTLAEECDPSVYVAVCSTVGAIIFSISPFFPGLTANAFSEAVRMKTTTGQASIVIVSAFLNIVHSLSPAQLVTFVTNTPVLMHFSADVSTCIQHLPHLIHLMEPLEIAFHQNLLRSLVVSFGRNPNHYFVDAVVRLISLEPKILMCELMGYIRANLLTQTVLALGPKLLADDRLYPLVSDEFLEEFVKISLEVIANKSAQLVDFEQACHTLSNILWHSNGDKLVALRERIDTAKLDDYPKHYLRFLLMMASKFDDFRFTENDSRTLRTTKLENLAKYLIKSGNDSEAAEAIAMLQGIFHTEKDNVLTSAISVLCQCFDIFVRIDREASTEMLLCVFRLDGLSWIQECERLKLCMSINVDVGYTLIDDFSGIVISKALENALSRHEELSAMAISCLKQITSREVIDKTLAQLRSIDIFDSFLALKYVEIVNALYDALGTNKFDVFARPLLEIAELHEDPHIVGLVFCFLTKIGHFKVSVDIMNMCVCWITRLYKSMAQCPAIVDPPSRDLPDLPPLIGSLETDIIAVPIYELMMDSLSPLKFCLIYFLSLTSTRDTRALYFMFDMVCLFPVEVLSRAVDYMQVIRNDFHGLVAIVLNSTNSFECAAACCEFLCLAPLSCRLGAVSTVKYLIMHPKVTSGATLFSFYKFLNFCDVKEASELLEKAKKHLSDAALVTLEVKLCGSDQKMFAELISKVPFDQWPVSDQDFCVQLESLDEKNFEISNFESLDGQHWKYLFEHMEMFALAGFEEYQDNHRHSLYKYQDMMWNTQNFTFSPLEVHNLSHSILPKILSNQYEFDPCLMKNFFRFTKCVIKQEIYDKMFNDAIDSQDSELIQYAIAYGVRESLTFDHKRLVEKCSELMRSSPQLMKFMADHVPKGEIELPDEIDIDKIDVNGTDFDCFALRMNSEKYLTQYLQKMHIKSKTLIHLTKLVGRFRMPGQTIIDFCMKNFNTILASPKRLVACLRLLRVALVNARTCPRLFGKLFPYVDSDAATVHVELSRILLGLFVGVEINSGILEWVERANKMSTTLCPYLTVISVLYSYTNHHMSTLNKSAIAGALSNVCDIPSIRMNGLSVIETLVKGSPSAWALFNQCWDVFVQTIFKVHDRPLFDQKINTILAVLVKRQEFHSRLHLYVPKLAELLFRSVPNSPYFASRMNLLQALAPSIPFPCNPYEDFIQCVLNSQEKDPISLSVLVDGMKWMIDHEENDTGRAEMTISLINYTFKFVLKFSGDDSIGAFMDSLWLPHCDFETAFTGIWKLGLLDFPMLKVVVLLHMFKRRCSPEQIDICKRMISFLYDSFQDKWKVEAFEKVFNGDPVGAAEVLI